MPKTDAEVLSELLSTSLKLDEARIASMKDADGSWKDDAPQQLLQFDSERVTARDAEWEKKMSEKAGKVKRETLEELEKSLRDEFGVKDAPARGVDLVKHIVASRAKAGDKEITPELIKAHPLYIELEGKAREFPTLLEKTVKEREQAIMAEFEEKALTREAIAKGKAIFQGMRPILPKNAEVAAAQMTLLENVITSHKLQFVKDAQGNLTDIIPMKADGSGRLEDAHGHPIKFEDLVRSGAKRFFEFEEGERKKGAPDPNDGGRGTGDADGDGDGEDYNPRTIAEYTEMFAKIEREEPDRAKRIELWAKLKAAGVKNGVVAA